MISSYELINPGVLQTASFHVPFKIAAVLKKDIENNLFFE
jgi:hypothetical protein